MSAPRAAPVAAVVATLAAIGLCFWARDTRLSHAQMYSLFQVLALLTALALRPKSALPLRQRLALYAGAIAGAGIGSKLPFALLSGAPWTAPAWFSDGKTIMAGLAGGYVGVEIAKRLAGIRGKTGDGFAVPLAGAVAVGRWGCFFNGCCTAPHVPVPVIESGFHAAMAAVLWRLQAVDALRHQRLKLYLISYCAFRFGIEFVRTEPRIWHGLTAYQLGAAAFAAALAAQWAWDAKHPQEDAVPATCP